MKIYKSRGFFLYVRSQQPTVIVWRVECLHWAKLNQMKKWKTKRCVSLYTKLLDRYCGLYYWSRNRTHALVKKKPKSKWEKITLVCHVMNRWLIECAFVDSVHLCEHFVLVHSVVFSSFAIISLLSISTSARVSTPRQNELKIADDSMHDWLTYSMLLLVVYVIDLFLNALFAYQ